MADAADDFSILAGAGVPIRSFKAGESIFKEGDSALEFFVVKSGSVDIRLGNRVLETVRDGIFGEMALVDSEPRMTVSPRPTSTWCQSARSGSCSSSARRRSSRSR
jgi:CRP-like cAMP-binding protein